MVVLVVITPSCNAAAATTGLKMEPGAKVPLKARLMKG